MPTINLGRVRFNWRGQYDPLVAYQEYDCVEDDGQSYVCIAPVTGTGPNDTGGGTYWGSMLIRSADYNQARQDAIDAATAAENSATTAGQKATAASQSATTAGNAEAKADQWANEAEDVEVEAGKYSAFHHAQKAAAFGDPNQFDITADQTTDTRTMAQWAAQSRTNQQAVPNHEDATDPHTQYMDEARLLTYLGRRNLLINGGFKVWQEGTSKAFSGSSGMPYFSDMWKSSVTNGSMTAAKSTLGGTQTPCATLTVDTAATDLTLSNHWHGFVSPVEANNVYHANGNYVTISFLFHATFSGTIPVCIRNGDDTRSYVTTFDCVANTTVRVTKTIKMEASTVAASGTGTGLSIVVGFQNEGDYVAASTDQWIAGNFLTTAACTSWAKTVGNKISIAEVQLEVGETATPFEHLSYGEELALCQRYLAKLDYGNLGKRVVNYSSSNASVAPSGDWPVSMRTIPSVAFGWEIQDVTQSGSPATVVVTKDGWAFDHPVAAGNNVDVNNITADARL